MAPAPGQPSLLTAPASAAAAGTCTQCSTHAQSHSTSELATTSAPSLVLFACPKILSRIIAQVVLHCYSKPHPEAPVFVIARLQIDPGSDALSSSCCLPADDSWVACVQGRLDGNDELWDHRQDAVATCTTHRGTASCSHQVPGCMHRAQSPLPMQDTLSGVGLSCSDNCSSMCF
jgi:hypothetical protein